MQYEQIQETVRNAKKTLFLYSSGGGGHKSAKDALKERKVKEISDGLPLGIMKPEELRVAIGKAAQAQHKIIERDVLCDYLGAVGSNSAKAWDDAQKAGNVPKQEKLAGLQWLSDKVFYVPIFIQTLSTLISDRPDEIVCTQAMANTAILDAMRVYNRLFKSKESNPLKMKLYMTDLPTELSKHFFDPISKMSKGQKDLLEIYAPDIKDMNLLTKAPLERLANDQLPIREAFIEAGENLNFKELNTVSIKDTDGVIQKHELGSDPAYFIMLGSQPTESAINGYIDTFKKRAEAPGEKMHLFIFTGKYEKEKDCLYKRLAKKGLPDWIHPICYQNAEQLVGLFARCHTITRSGGATAMELMVMDGILENQLSEKPKRYIHSEKVASRSLLDSIPLWERGNFLCLADQNIVEKEPTSPETLF